jgi:hypothetical protein
LLPVFVNLADPLGGKAQEWGDTFYQPMLFYMVALALKVLPFTEAVIRLPVALVGGMITPMVMFLMAWRLLGSGPGALAATLVVALAPTHVVLSRQALDYVMPIPFVICWLWSLKLFMDSRKTLFIVMAGAFLGVGCYSYIASWAMMPIYLLITWIVVLRAGLGLRPIVMSAIAFAVPVSVGLIWVLAHPDMLAQTATRYDTAIDGPHYGFFETYLSMLKPLVLFVRGGPAATTSTARSGFVLLPFALLIVAGLWQLARRRDWIAAVILAGIITAPIPAAYKGEPGMIQRAMYLLPFLGLLGALGYAALWESKKWAWRGIAIATIVLAPLQFGYFYYDYFGHYKLRSAFYYDPVAFHLIPESLLRQAPAPAYYFTTDVDDASVKWRYYLTKYERTDWLARTKYIAPDVRPDAVPGSILITYIDDPRIRALHNDGWFVEHLISDVDNRLAAAILRKRG